MMRRWSAVALLLVVMVYASGCIGSSGGNETFSLHTKTSPSIHAVEGWSAMVASIKATFFIENGSQNVSIEKNFPLVLVKMSSDVKNVTGAFPLGNGVYEIPPYSWTPRNGDENFTSILVVMNNGTTASIEFTMKGKPMGSVNTRIYFRVERLTNGSYMVRGVGASPGMFGAFGKEYSLILKPDTSKVRIAEIAKGSYEGNWTYLLPPTNSWSSGNTKTTVEYSIALIYLKSGDNEAFVGKIYFPYEKIKKKIG